MCEVIETNRLVLRPYADSDLSRQVELANDIQVLRMTGSMPFPYTEDDARAWMAKHDQDWQAGKHYPFAIVDPEEGLIGYVGLFLQENGMYELGYWIARKWWGRGLAYEAADAILKWAEGKLGLRAAQAKFFADNPASGRVLDKLGFLRTGVVEDGYSRARGESAPSVGMIWMN